MHRHVVGFTILFILSSCRSSSSDLGEMVNVGDPKMAIQLVSGFHPIENGWRWTTGHFVVGVKTPKRAASEGAVLLLRYSVPEILQGERSQTKIQMSVAGVKLAEEETSRFGLQEIRREVPAEALRNKDIVRLEFWVEPVRQPQGEDRRELGVIVHEVGLTRK
ncbi:MAG: hypothetical protein NZV14_11400 [Bryobacteraceae bacterium]|nr:hypothetical protein [Bryobacteraceae bacterium]MDW8378759.1 hypothetical protein [Bryobacterales bacterium]